MNEYKFTCKRCSNIWYVNKERLDSLINKDKWDRRLAIANSIFGMFGNSRNQDAANHFTREREINELSGADLIRCPNCRSENFVYEEVKDTEVYVVDPSDSPVKGFYVIFRKEPKSELVQMDGSFGTGIYLLKTFRSAREAIQWAEAAPRQWVVKNKNKY